MRWFRRRDGGEPPAGGWFHGAHRVRVREVNVSSMREDKPVKPMVLYETTDPAEISSLAKALQTGAEGVGHCMCYGTLVYEIESAAGTRQLSLHHGVTLREEGAFDNVPLLSPDACMDWLSARGITFVREEYEQARQRDAESQAHAERWRAALPSSLARFFDEMGDGMGFAGKPQPEWTAALASEYPDLGQRAVMLLRLFGSGAGPWSGYPSYEGVPEALLLEMPLDVLLAAAEEATDDRVTEGAARLFAGWYFGCQRPDDRAALPAELKRRLLEHAERSAHDDNRVRARAAFAK
jgi:hypothetical protein